jgi:SprT-like family
LQAIYGDDSEACFFFKEWALAPSPGKRSQGKLSMRVRILVSLLSLAVICFGVQYAIGREQLRRPDYLHALYQETNKEFFDGQLPDVVVKVENLSEARAEGETYMETQDLFVIVLDPKWNTSEDEALDTMRHESCHVATWEQEGSGPDPHGPRFQECMKRFQNEK